MMYVTLTVQIWWRRLSTIRFADKIAVVDHGCIVEEGTHESLLNMAQGHYSKLYQKSAPAGSTNSLTASGTPMGSTNSLTGLFAKAQHKAEVSCSICSHKKGK